MMTEQEILSAGREVERKIAALEARFIQPQQDIPGMADMEDFTLDDIQIDQMPDRVNQTDGESEPTLAKAARTDSSRYATSMDRTDSNLYCIGGFHDGSVADQRSRVPLFHHKTRRRVLDFYPNSLTRGFIHHTGLLPHPWNDTAYSFLGTDTIWASKDNTDCTYTFGMYRRFLTVHDGTIRWPNVTNPLNSSKISIA